MTYLNVVGVVAGPRLTIGAMTVYSGHLSLGRNKDFRGIVRPTDTQPPTTMWLEIGLRRIRTVGNPTMAHFGAYDEQVGLAPDPRGGEHRWLQVSLRVPLTSVEDIDLNYRVTVQA